MLDSGLHSRCHTSEAVTKGNCTALVHTTCRQHDSYFVPTLRLWSTPWGLKVVIRGHSLIKEMMVDGVLRGLKEQAEHQTEDSDCYIMDCCVNVMQTEATGIIRVCAPWDSE